MDFINKIAASIVVSSIFVATTFADVVSPTDLKQTDSTDTSITFSWIPVDGAFGYYIYSGEKSADKFGEFVTEPEYTLTGLKADTSYMVAVTAVGDNDEESEKSAQVAMKTKGAGQKAIADKKEKKEVKTAMDTNADFGLSRIELMSASEINLVFTKNLEEGQEIADQIELESKDGDIIELKNVNFGMTPNTIVASLPKDLKTNTDYKVTILALRDAAGNVIENGIDAVTNFTTPAEFKSGEVVVIDTKEQKVEVKTTKQLQEEKMKEVAGETPEKKSEKKEELPELDAAGLEQKTKEGLTKEEVKPTQTEETAKTAEKLPEAGAEHIFLLFVALLTAAGFAFYSSKKNK